MKEFIKHGSCRLAEGGKEKHGRTFSSSTADGINHVTNGLIPDEDSAVAHTIMTIGAGSLVLSCGISWLALIFILIVFIIIFFWCIGQKDEAVRNIPGREFC